MMLVCIVAIVLLVIWFACDIIVYCKRKKEEGNYCLGYGGSRYAKRICNRIKFIITVVGIVIIAVNIFWK